MHDSTDVSQQARRIEELIAKLELSADPAIVSTARALVECLMDLHGAALQRMLDIVSKTGAAGQEITDGFGRDDLVGSLLVLYGLHPVDLEIRVRQAVAKLKNCDIDVLSLNGGVVRLRVRAANLDCGSSAGSLKTAVQDAVFGAAPDVAELTIEGLDETGASSNFVPIERLMESGAVKATV